MYPHERSLVTKMKDKPFVLLGVNTDRSLAELQKAIADNKLNWRSWWDGPHGAGNGPIARSYQVESFPTVFLIDHKGQVRQKYEGAPDSASLEKAINSLIREAQADRGQ